MGSGNGLKYPRTAHGQDRDSVSLLIKNRISYEKYIQLCLSAIGCLMMASCDFLDVVPQGTATVDDIYRTQYQAEGMVLSCYANIPNYFHPQQFPDFTGGNEIITSKRRNNALVSFPQSGLWGRIPQQRLITHYGQYSKNLIRRVL